MDGSISSNGSTISWRFSTRADGDMRSLSVFESWLASKNYNSHSYIIAKQIHSTNVYVADTTTIGKQIHGYDGFVASREHISSAIVLGVKTADCIPILFYDAENKVISAAHAGWRGTQSNMVRQCIGKMMEEGANKSSIKVIIGPHIKVCCYMVSENFAPDFDTVYNSKIKKNGSIYVDLEKATRLQLEQMGILSQNISSINECTCCHSHKYFSYRKDSQESFGEQIAIISLQV